MQLSLRSISKRYPGITVFDDASLEIAPGTRVVLLGPNGAGKTTLLRCLATLSSPDSGDIYIDDERLTRGRLDLRRRTMFLPDFPPVFGSFDPLEMIAMHLKLWEADRPGVEDKVADLMDRLQLGALAGVPVLTFSRGQRYKTALAALIAVDPELWLLDEPFASGMDPQGIETFREEALAACERGRIIFYSTQMVELAVEFSDRIAVINKGTITLYDPERDFDRDPRRLAQKLVRPKS